MSDSTDFLDVVLPRIASADMALHNGDPRRRIDLWSRTEPLTLFGAVLTARGWRDIHRAFERLGARFSYCESFENEVVAARVSGDLAYTVAFEHTTASIDGAPPTPYTLRVTTIFCRENGEWKIVHRHGDALTTDRHQDARPAGRAGPSARDGH